MIRTTCTRQLHHPGGEGPWDGGREREGTGFAFLSRPCKNNRCHLLGCAAADTMHGAHLTHCRGLVRSLPRTRFHFGKSLTSMLSFPVLGSMLPWWRDNVLSHQGDTGLLSARLRGVFTNT